MKKIYSTYGILYILFIFFLIFLLPLLCLWIFPEIKQDQNYSYSGNIPETVTIYLTKEEKYKTIPFEDYVAGVVASEMPASFETEALKAQAVASRTYALGKIKSGAELCDSVHCQVYRSDNISDHVRNAVKETSGQVLLYKGELASHTLFFASSAGKTENSEDVFTNPVPYLVSVASNDEPGATHKKENFTISFSELKKTLEESFPEKNFGELNKNNIKIKSYTRGGRVREIQTGNEILSGTEIRSSLKLFSSRIQLSFKDNTITFTTSGSGHGVGMSQYGANGMAKDGKTYKKILSHYYKGTKVSL